MQDLLSSLQRAVWAATDAVRQNPEVTLLSAVGAYLLLLVLMFALWVRTHKIVKRQRALFAGANGQSIEQMLLSQVSDADAVRQQITDALRSGQENADSQRRSLQRVGLVRFDAFNDVGGEQSFALAILDDGGSGIVLSGLYSRNDMRVYAKPVTRGASSLTLSDEERRAIASAQSADADTTPAAKTGSRPRRPQPQS